MHKRVACACLLMTTLQGQTPSRLNYPDARKSDRTDDYGGHKVADPYRWLEDADSAETAKCVAAENEVTDGWLAKLPGREKIRARLTQLFDYERYPAQALNIYAGAFKAGGRYFLFHNDGLQNQDVLYTMDSPTAHGKALLDPNTLRADGTAALTGLSVSRDGKRLGYALAQAGSDWSEWRVRDIATGKDLPDLVQWTKFTQLQWTADNAGFYYMRYPEPKGNMLTGANRDAKVYFHRLGQPAATDRLIFEDPAHPEWRFHPILTDDGHYLVLHVDVGDAGKNLLAYLDLRQPKPTAVWLVDRIDNRYEFIGSEGGRFWMVTTDGAPKGRLMAIDINQPARDRWHQVVGEQPETLDSVTLADGKFLLSYLKDAHAQARLHSLDGARLRDVALPGLGSVAWSPALPGDTELFYSFTTFTAPASLYRYDLRTGTSTPIRKSKLSFDPDRFETEQVFYTSKDGTQVPMFLVHRKGLARNGKNPTLLYGYGGFNIAITPAFNPAYIDWMEMGGIFAVANLRGGSEYGEDWHLAGTKLHKQNVFDDFIAAAEWLIRSKYTETPKLAIYGGSNGGLLVGACLNQRPDLFGAAMPAVGVMDMLRFNKFTVGAGWEGDYGSPENPQEFEALRAYSPLHNIRKGGQYPPTLITTSDHDDRVVPGHSFKYAAALQAAQEGPAPILIRIETRAGHGAGMPTSKRIDEFADRWAFLVKALAITPAL
jgi:prolyl oligopeptidase